MTEFDRRAAYLELLRTCVEGFEDLDILLELMRVEAHAATLLSLSTHLRLRETQISDALERLCRCGLVIATSDGRYGIHVRDQRTTEALQQLRIEFESDRFGVMAQVSANAIARVRTRAMRAFAGAFVVGRKTDG